MQCDARLLPTRRALWASGWAALVLASASTNASDQAWAQTAGAVNASVENSTTVSTPSFSNANESLTCGQDAPALPFDITPEPQGHVQAANYTEAERQCWLTLAQADAQAHQASQAAPVGQPPQWVDVRDRGQTQRLSAQGVPQVPLANLGDRAFLKGLPLVLLGNDVDLKALSAQCVALRKSGHFPQVNVLLGGIRTWERAGKPVVRGSGAQIDTALVSPQETWVGASSGVWQIAAVGLSEADIAQLPVAPAVRMATRTRPAPEDARALWQALDEQMRRTPTEAPRQWLIVTANPTQQAQLMQVWRKASADASSAVKTETPSAQHQTTWLAGGVTAYLHYLQQQLALAQGAGRSLPRICGM